MEPRTASAEVIPNRRQWTLYIRQ